MLIVVWYYVRTGRAVSPCMSLVICVVCCVVCARLVVLLRCSTLLLLVGFSLCSCGVRLCPVRPLFSPTAAPSYVARLVRSPCPSVICFPCLLLCAPRPWCASGFGRLRRLRSAAAFGSIGALSWTADDLKPY